MVVILKGTFLMGSPEDEEGRKDNEEQHQVVIAKLFAMSRYAHWIPALATTPSAPRDSRAYAVGILARDDTVEARPFSGDGRSARFAGRMW